MIDFELRYIHPTWASKTEVLSIEKSDSCIEIEEITPNEYVASTIAYIRINKNVDAYIGIKLYATDVTPYVELADGQLIPLQLVKGPDNDTWWIISNGWDKKHNEFDSHAFYKIGKISIFINKKHLVLTNEPNNFTYSDLEYILSDFKSDMWQLLVDENSITSTDIKNNIPGFKSDESILLLEKFLLGVEKILKHPEKKVVQIVEEKSRNKAKCTKDTINDLIKHPYSLKLKSRGNVESFDTSCNRYIHFCLNRIIYIMNIYKKISEEKKVFIRDSLSNLEKKKIKYLEQDYKKLEQEVFRNQIQSLEDKLELLKNNLQTPVNNSNYIYPNYDQLFKFEGKFIFTKKWGNEENNIYFIKMSSRPHLFRDFDYITLNLPLNWAQLLRCDSEFRKYIFYIQATFRYDFYLKNSVGLMLELNRIESLHIESPNLNALKNRTSSSVSISSEELDFLKEEKKTSYAKLSVFEDNFNYLNKIEDKLEPLIGKANKLKKQIEKLHIGVQDNYPQSILFVTNNLYSSTYNVYRSITERLGINDLLIHQLEKVEKIGLIKICEIYEYWCLINIIKALVLKLHFSIEDNWGIKLVNTILSAQKSNSPVSFCFIHKTQTTPIEIVLHYQYVLPSGKNPDFIIELRNKKTKISSKLVLDAKFRGDVTNEEIEYIVNQLYFDEDHVKKGKNYSEDGKNAVFILHTSSKAMFDCKGNFISLSPLRWGGYSSYGGENYLNHQRGHIFFLPSPRYSESLDNLQRLIGGFIQQNSDIESYENIITNTQNVICIGCGSENVKIKKWITKAGNEKYYITCQNCNLTSVKTLCFNCKRPLLYKNGLWWTYHINKATEIYNVVCPNCGAYF